jgi:hypothetical protein
MSVELLVANFLRIALEDLRGARLLAASDNRNAIYLCEQAAEKVIRAIVTSRPADTGRAARRNRGYGDRAGHGSAAVPGRPAAS